MAGRWQNKIRSHASARRDGVVDRWGAQGKVESLRREHVGLVDSKVVSTSGDIANVGTLSAPEELAVRLDLQSLLAVSYGISRELRLSKVLEAVITALTENSGAQRGELLLFANGQFEQASSYPEADVQDSTPSTKHAISWPQQIVNYVAHTRQPIALDYARSDPRFSDDAYLARVDPRAVLCVPIIWQNEFAGLIYLENRLTPGVFTTERVEVLELLAAQAGVAIQNARIVETLESKVAERTAELNRETERANAERFSAQAANRAKSEFVANMSHELNTPLNSIIRFSEILHEGTYGPLTETQTRHVSNILASGQHLLRLSTDLLDLSKIEAGRITLDMNQFSLNEAVSFRINTFRNRAEEKRVQLDLALATNNDLIVADETRIRQIVLNLLANAIKFTPTGGRVNVAVEVEHKQARLTFSDTGVGIPETEQANIFERFHRVESNSDAIEGTGLGLALAKRFVELHKGKFSVSSTLGMGSIFSISIPAEPAMRR